MKVIANKYKLIRLIGSGGMGEVFLGEVLGSYGFKRKIAVKLLPRDMRKDRVVREAFINEARTLAGVSHPNLVKVFDFGDAGDRLFLCMEYIRGFSLRELIKVTEKWGERIPLEITVKIVAEILEGLHYIHGMGIIHGDLTPKNIMIGVSGEFKILDFGLSRVLSHLPSEMPIGGKAGYTAPEVMREKRVIPASDLYSLGAIINELARAFDPDEGITPGKGFDFHDTLWEYSVECLDRDPEKRPDAKTLLERVKNVKRKLDSGFDIKDYLGQLFEEDEYTFVIPDGFPVKKTGNGISQLPKWAIIFAASVLIPFLFWWGGVQVQRNHESGKKEREGVLENEPKPDLTKELDAINKGRDEGGISAESARVTRSSPSSKGRWNTTPAPVENRVRPANEIFEVRSYPDNATVFLDGKNVGKTPVLIPIELIEGKGDSVLRLKLQGFKNKTVEISRNGDAAGKKIFVTLQRANGFLSVNVNPWAYVFIDGERLGTTPIIKRSLPAGKHTILLTNDKLGVSKSRNIDIEEGNTERVIEDFYK